MQEFSEIQTYGWIFNVISSIIIIVIVLFLWNYLEKKVYILFILPILLLVFYFMLEKLETNIDYTGIHYRMLPFQKSEKVIEWIEIENIQVREYIIYPGKTATISRFEVYAIFDDFGLYVFLKDGRRFIFGTNRPDEIKELLKQIHKF